MKWQHVVNIYLPINGNKRSKKDGNKLLVEVVDVDIAVKVDTCCREWGLTRSHSTQPLGKNQLYSPMCVRVEDKERWLTFFSVKRFVCQPPL